MDILTHTLSGIAVGTVLSSFAKGGFSEKFKIILISGFAGALPDIDAISLWSGFDSTFGRIFNLSHSGKEIYSGTFWYSHHAFFHSFFAGLLLMGFFGSFIYLIESKFRGLNFRKWINSLKRNWLLLLGFLLGFTIHLLEDMPTPSSSWGGVNFFWPANTYVGGTGEIWWWNNYDIFIITLSVVLINVMLLIVNRWLRRSLKLVIIAVFIIGFTLALFQIKTREYDFSYSDKKSNNEKFEAKSKVLQRDILGDKLFHLMEEFDNKLSIYF